MKKTIQISTLFDFPNHSIVDVRSSGEFEKGHIPQAINIPLFSNEERAIVGTAFKQINPDAAFKKGLDIVGPKMSSFVEMATKFVPNKKIIIHCWRGGKRSGSMAWLFDMAGFDVLVLAGGYKAYRQYIRQVFAATPPPFCILTGSTGSGKTKTLQLLKAKGEQIIDLEALAHHKGSAFGDLGELEQPSTEQFENDLYDVFRQLDTSKITWLESESRMVGNIPLPDTFWQVMSAAPMVHLHISKTARIQYLVQEYGHFPKEALVQSFQKLKKKLAQNLPIALAALDNGDLEQATTIALDYYDKYYNRHLEKNQQRIICKLDFLSMDFEQITDELLSLETVGYPYGI